VGRNILDAVGGDASEKGDAVPVTFELASFDPPPGGGEENDNLLGLAKDGDPETAWRTDKYNTRRLGGLKPGVGIVLTPTSGAAAKRLELASNSRGWKATVYVASERTSTLAGWGAPVATVAGDGSPVEIDLPGREGAVLLWLTDLGEDARFELQEAKLLG
jgi:hypothetical protein